MERESFEDEEVAALLNNTFVSIKVDREERPDIDAVYMAVCQAMHGHGGWPLTILMTADQLPFYSGTYLPKNTKNGLLGLMELIQRVSEVWRTDKTQLLSFGNDMLRYLQQKEVINNEAPTEDLLHEAVTMFKHSYDPIYGGFSSAPKFPTPHNLLFLLRYSQMHENNQVLPMVENTLKKMYQGGIFDHIGGGFSRYSTDNAWLVPHFEKMLYDNALLLYTYVECYQKTNEPLYQYIGERIIKYILAELTDKQGGFYCGQDADSEGIEGKYYVFTPEEIMKVLGKQDANYFNEQFDITEEGNFEGKSIPNLLKNSNPFLYTFDDIFQILYDYRLKRTKLHKDDKILTSWNGLMIAALAKAARIWHDERCLLAAKKADSFIKTKLTTRKGTLYVRYRDNESVGEGKIDDYAFYAWALLELYESTFDISYLEDCIKIVNNIITNFFDEKDGGCYLYSKEGEVLIQRPKEVYDGAIPSGNSVFALVLAQLYRISGEPKWNDINTKQLAFLTGHIKDYPAAYSFSLIAIQHVLAPSKELICVTKDIKDAEPLICFLSEIYQPNLTVIIKTQENADKLKTIAPYTNDYPIPDEGIVYYLCQNNACSAPMNNMKELRAILLS